MSPATAATRRYKCALVVLMLAACIAIAYYTMAIRGTDAVHTHLFYIPIVLAAIWWGWRGVLVPAFLVIVYLLMCLISGLEAQAVYVIERSLLFMSIGCVTAWLSERRQRAEHDYGTLFEHAGCAMAAISENQTLLKVNRAFEEMNGYSRDETEGTMKFSDLLPECGKKCNAGRAGEVDLSHREAGRKWIIS